MTPTERTLRECRKRGWVCDVTERWLPKTRVRKDLFGFGDVLAMTEQNGSLIIQTTTTGNMTARVRKIKRLDTARAWLSRGNDIEVWGWALRGPAGKRKLWQLKTSPITLEDL